MAGVQKPAMDSLGAMMKAGGPKDDKEWAQVQQNAALLAEAGQLLLMGDRPKDQDVWVKNGAHSATRVVGREGGRRQGCGRLQSVHGRHCRSLQRLPQPLPQADPVVRIDRPSPLSPQPVWRIWRR